MLEEYMTPYEAAHELGYNIEHVWRLLREGRLHGHRWGRAWLVERSAVKDWRTQHPSQEVRT